MIEAKKLAYADLVRYIGDPKFSKLPVAQLLSKAFAAERAKLIDPEPRELQRGAGHALPRGRRHDLSERCRSRRQHGLADPKQLLGVRLGRRRRRHRIRFA